MEQICIFSHSVSKYVTNKHTASRAPTNIFATTTVCENITMPAALSRTLISKKSGKR